MSENQSLEQITKDYGEFLQNWARELRECCQLFSEALEKLEQDAKKEKEH